MSNSTGPAASDAAHEGLIKNPKQVLLAAFFAIVVPICVIIGLVNFVTTGNKPGAGAADQEKAVALRIQKVGSVEIRAANHELQTGEQVFHAQCTNCHTAGVLGAPKFGDAAAWEPRIKTGYDTLLNAALHGFKAMPPQGGGVFSDLEVARALVYMANAAGAHFDEPKAPESSSSAPAQ